ncbi:hypothetical protein LguiB_027951 [Lonicera macranthoides]
MDEGQVLEEEEIDNEEIGEDEMDEDVNDEDMGDEEIDKEFYEAIQSKDAICMAVAQLKLEFQNIKTGVTNATKVPSSTNLLLCSTNMLSSASDDTTTSYEINIVSPNSPNTAGAISRHSCIAKRMNLAGYVGECFKVYQCV